MITIICLCFALVIAAFYLNSQATSEQTRVNSMAVLAQQMIIYHSAANQKCGGSCTGAIDPTTALASYRQNADHGGAGSLASATVGDYIYTYYTGNESTQEERAATSAGIIAAIIEERKWDTQSWLGQFDQATGRLAYRANSYWYDPRTPGADPVKATVPDVVLTGANIPDGAPVLVNRK